MILDHETVYIVDFGGQYKQLIARRVREANVFSEIVLTEKIMQKINQKRPLAIIFTGGPASVHDENAPTIDPAIFELGIPVLGICYGAQLTTKLLKGQIEKPQKREYGKTKISYQDSVLFKGMDSDNICWMSHTDQIKELPDGFSVIATTTDCPVAAMEDKDRNIYGVQFHPEVEHTQQGKQLIHNFLYQIAGASGDFTEQSFIQEQIQKIRNTVGKKKVLCGLSGGVDSSVAAVLVHQAIGDQLTCIFVDHGLLRKNEGDDVERIFRKQFDMNLIRVDAEKRFLDRLRGIIDPEQKRKIIGNEFIRVFEEEAEKLGDIDFLVQGTIYPDVIESGGGNAAVIKSHHNVGGLPEDMTFSLIEPLRDLFKDEVRKVGLELGIPEDLIYRHPFPGPGLGIRVLGEVTKHRCDILREADYIYREELEKAGLGRKIWQAFATLPDVLTVGVMGDERTYSYMVGLRAVTSSDGMTGEFYPIPYEVLDTISRRIVNEVDGVNRVVYDVTGKPPATIEWE